MSGAIEKKVFVLVVLALSGFSHAQDEELASEAGSEVGKIADNFRDAVTRIAKDNTLGEAADSLDQARENFERTASETISEIEKKYSDLNTAADKVHEDVTKEAEDIAEQIKKWFRDNLPIIVAVLVGIVALCCFCCLCVFCCCPWCCSECCDLRALCCCGNRHVYV